MDFSSAGRAHLSCRSAKILTDNLMLEYFQCVYTRATAATTISLFMNEVYVGIWCYFNFFFIQLNSNHRNIEKKNERHKRCLNEENDEYFKLWLICYLFSGGETKLGESIISFTNLNESFFNKAPFSFISNRHRICQQVC